MAEEKNNSRIERLVREEGNHGFEVEIMGGILLGLTLGFGAIGLGKALISDEKAEKAVYSQQQYENLSISEKIGLNLGPAGFVTLGATTILPFIMAGPIVGTYYEERARKKYGAIQ